MKREVGEEWGKLETGDESPHVLRLGYTGGDDVSCEKYRGNLGSEENLQLRALQGSDSSNLT